MSSGYFIRFDVKQYDMVPDDVIRCGTIQNDDLMRCNLVEMIVYEVV